MKVLRSSVYYVRIMQPHYIVVLFYGRRPFPAFFFFCCLYRKARAFEVQVTSCTYYEIHLTLAFEDLPQNEHNCFYSSEARSTFFMVIRMNTQYPRCTQTQTAQTEPESIIISAVKNIFIQIERVFLPHAFLIVYS